MIDFTKPVQTRDGRKVRILCTDRKPEPGGHTVIGLVTSDSGIEWIYAWPASGQYKDKPGPDDLINTQPPKRTVWLNVYPGGIVTGPHGTKVKADDVAIVIGRDRRIDCIPVEVPTE